MSKRARRHHLVPAFYLKRFADANGRISRVDTTTGFERVLSIGDATVETDFYTIATEAGPSDIIEGHISRIESLASQAFRTLDSGQQLTLDDITGLSNFIALQLVRGRDFRDTINRFTRDIMRKVMQLEAMSPESARKHIEEALGEAISDEELAEHLEWMSAEDLEVELHPNQSIETMLAAASPLVQPLAEMRWNILRVNQPLFVTSDRPVAMWSRVPGPFGAVGVATADEISLPVDPLTHLVLTREGIQPDPETTMFVLLSRTLSSAHDWVFLPPRQLER